MHVIAKVAASCVQFHMPKERQFRGHVAATRYLTRNAVNSIMDNAAIGDHMPIVSWHLPGSWYLIGRMTTFVATIKFDDNSANNR